MIGFLQIGFQKCATTFFYKDVYGIHPDINCIQPAECYWLDKTLIDKLVVCDEFEYSEEKFKQSFSIRCYPYCTREKLNGIIYEPFTYLYQRKLDRKVVLDRIYECFPNSKIIAFVRNQKAWLLSNYSEYIKSGGLLSLDDFVEVNLKNPFLDGYYLNYYPAVEYLHDKGNALVCVFEEFQEDNQKVCNDIFDFLGVERVEVTPINRNASLNKNILQVLRFVNGLLRYDCGSSPYNFFEDYKFGTRSARIKNKVKYFMKKVLLVLSYKANKENGDKFKLSSKSEIMIDSKYKRSNMKLAKLLNKNLQSRGY